MEIMIASDLHGSAYATKRLLDVFARREPDRLLLLGDLLYHGPRNALPREYDPPQAAEALNAVKDRLLCVRGNCDAEVDQMVLEFPILADYMIWYDGTNMIFTTHGHIRGELNPPPMPPGSILLHGHTHVPAARRTAWGVYLNPGSVSIPKEGWPASYMVYQDGLFRVLELENDQELLRFETV